MAAQHTALVGLRRAQSSQRSSRTVAEAPEELDHSFGDFVRKPCALAYVSDAAPARHLPALGASRRLALFLILPLLLNIDTTRGGQPSASPTPPTPGPTPIPLTVIPVEERTTIASLQEIDASVSRDKLSVTDFAGNL